MKKILEILKSKWAEYLIEILVIIIGVLGAFLLSSWNEDRKDGIAENQALVALKSEFVKNSERLKFICEGRKTAYTDRLRYWNLITNKKIPLQTKIESYPKGFFGGAWAVQNTVLMGLINSGQIENIKNDTLKQLLAAWPDKVQFWNDDEDKWRADKDALSDYLRDKIRRVPAFTLQGKYWQNKAEDYKEERNSQIISFINELEYQNLIVNNINQLYIQSIHCDDLLAYYEKIISNINNEIKDRNIK